MTPHIDPRLFSLTYLKGVGPKRAELLKKELGLSTILDLLYQVPTHYTDRSRVRQIASFEGEMPAVLVRGRFVSFARHGEGAKARRVGLFTDGTRTMEIVWFRRLKEIERLYVTGRDYVVFGRPTMFQNRWSMVHPEIDAEGSDLAAEGLRGVYPLTETLRNRGFTSRTFNTLVHTALAIPGLTIDDPMTPGMRDRLRMMPLAQAIAEVHFPTSNQTLLEARRRLKFDELFYLQLDILRYARHRREASAGQRFGLIGTYFNTFYSRFLPFELTGAQKRVVREIHRDMSTGRQMNRLLQGDVGSGKTLVAVLSALIALDNGAQACIMAPTEILATQHFHSISQLLAPAGINVRLLTGSTGARERADIDRELQDGTLHLLIGTHAVIEDRVQFRNLGLVIIDEQHRFGVAQRARLWAKNSMPPHVLVMTATPIPRTLAMTVYGDLAVSVIDELPPGRKPVKTLLRYDDRRLEVYRGISQQLAKGRQVYIVYPLIDENEKLDLTSLAEGYEEIRETFRNHTIAYVHGRMKPAEKDHQMNLFASGRAEILVATTVIEVGVNVPNATTMVIENAERFGLSQLHQLRGRVGRGDAESYCILMSRHNISRETRRRLEIMTQTTDGFVIAEEDLKMRGPGDLEGTMQSGLPVNLRLASLTQDGPVLEEARREAETLLDADPSLIAPDNVAIARELAVRFPRSADWGRIS